MANLSKSKAQQHLYPITEMQVDTVFSQHCTLRAHGGQAEGQTHGMQSDTSSPLSAVLQFSHS